MRGRARVASDWLLAVGGVLGACVSISLLVSVLVRSQGFPVVGYFFAFGTLLLLYAGSASAILLSGRLSTLVAASVLLWLALTAIILGLVWLFYAALLIAFPVLLVSIGTALRVIVR